MVPAGYFIYDPLSILIFFPSPMSSMQSFTQTRSNRIPVGHFLSTSLRTWSKYFIDCRSSYLHRCPPNFLFIASHSSYNFCWISGFIASSYAANVSMVELWSNLWLMKILSLMKIFISKRIRKFTRRRKIQTHLTLFLRHSMPLLRLRSPRVFRPLQISHPFFLHSMYHHELASSCLTYRVDKYFSLFERPMYP